MQSSLSTPINYDRAEPVFSDLKAYYKGLIALRRAHKSFYLDTVDEIKKSVHFMDDMPDGVVAYTIDNDTEKVFVAYNAGKNKSQLNLQMLCGRFLQMNLCGR